MKITAQKIAEECGVSRGTVDRVINGRSGVSPEVRARVEEAVQRTGYRTPSARRTAETTITIGVILPPRDLRYYTAQIRAGVRAAQKRATKEKLEVVVEQLSGGGAREYLTCIARMRQRGIQGFVLNASDVPIIRDEIDRLAALGVPVVTCDTDVTGSARICHVGQELRRSGRMAAGLMTRLAGNGDVLVVTGNSEYTTHRGRVDGFSARLAELMERAPRYRVAECIERYDLTYDCVLREARENPRLRGIYMATESVRACVDALARAKLARQVHVVCHDLTPWARQYLLEDKIDFVLGLDFAKHAERAVLILYTLLGTGKRPAQESEAVPTSIISREMVE